MRGIPHTIAAAAVITFTLVSTNATFSPRSSQPVVVEGSASGGPLFGAEDEPLVPGQPITRCTTVRWHGDGGDIRVAAEVSGALARHLEVEVRVGDRCGGTGRTVYRGTLAGLTDPAAANPVHVDGPRSLAYRIDVTLSEDAPPVGPASADFVWTATSA